MLEKVFKKNFGNNFEKNIEKNFEKIFSFQNRAPGKCKMRNWVNGRFFLPTRGVTLYYCILT